MRTKMDTKTTHNRLSCLSFPIFNRAAVVVVEAVVSAVVVVAAAEQFHRFSGQTTSGLVWPANDESSLPI